MECAKAYFNWSSGKDSALALYIALQEKRRVGTLFSVVHGDSGRIAMHEISEALLNRQAEAIGMPLTVFHYDPLWSREAYAHAMRQQIEYLKEKKMTTALFGDLNLEPLRRSREENCRRSGIAAEFPLWNWPADKIMKTFIGLGFQAVVTSIDHRVLPDSFLGRVIDENFLADLPTQADICGENGEYHSFVYDGPIFQKPVSFSIKSRFSREYPEENGMHRYCYLELE